MRDKPRWEIIHGDSLTITAICSAASKSGSIRRA